MYRLIALATVSAMVLGLAACDPVGTSSGTRASKYQGSRAGVR